MKKCINSLTDGLVFYYPFGITPKELTNHRKIVLKVIPEDDSIIVASVSSIKPNIKLKHTVQYITNNHHHSIKQLSHIPPRFVELLKFTDVCPDLINIKNPSPVLPPCIKKSYLKNIIDVLKYNKDFLSNEVSEILYP